jgi:hypothetical protein
MKFHGPRRVGPRSAVHEAREHYGRYVAKDPESKYLRRKALTAVAAKMARVAHAIVRSGTDYRPFFEQPVPSGRTSLC